MVLKLKSQSYHQKLPLCFFHMLYSSVECRLASWESDTVCCICSSPKSRWFYQKLAFWLLLNASFAPWSEFLVNDKIYWICGVQKLVELTIMWTLPSWTWLVRDGDYASRKGLGIRIEVILEWKQQAFNIWLQLKVRHFGKWSSFIEVYGNLKAMYHFDFVFYLKHFFPLLEDCGHLEQVGLVDRNLLFLPTVFP